MSYKDVREIYLFEPDQYFELNDMLSSKWEKAYKGTHICPLGYVQCSTFSFSTGFKVCYMHD